jgi:ABC-type nitrate/sulfonate/bicarbonate transport system permease component
VACWEFATRSGGISAFMLPPISAVVARLAADVMSGDFFLNAGLTLYRTFLGFAIAAATGVTLGLLMARNRWAVACAYHGAQTGQGRCRRLPTRSHAWPGL